MEYIAFDCHKRYTWAVVKEERDRLVREGKIPHQRGSLREFLSRCREGSPAVETVGNWYWIVDEIEQAGCRPRLVHAGKAKLMLGAVNKTDKLDARGLNKLQRTGTLPEVWIPPGELRDKRELPRTRMVLVRERTKLEQRIHAALTKYGLQGANYPFGVTARQFLQGGLEILLVVRCLIPGGPGREHGGHMGQKDPTKRLGSAPVKERHAAGMAKRRVPPERT